MAGKGKPHQTPLTRQAQSKKDLASLFVGSLTVSSPPNTPFANGCDDYMAASRRSPLIRDQWRSDDEFRDRPYHRSRESYDARPRPNPASDTHPAERDLKLRGRATGEEEYRSPRHDRDRSIEYRRESRRDYYRSPRRSGHGEGLDRERDRDQEQERHRRRSRHRERSPIPHTSKRARSPAPVYRDHPDYSQRDEYSSRRSVRESGSERRRERDHSPHSSRYTSSRDPLPHYSERSSREPYPPVYRRGRSRSPYDPHFRTSIRRSPSSDRYDRGREQEHYKDQEPFHDSERRERGYSPGSRPRVDASRTSSTKPSKSSKRSDKQKARTLKHLREKVKSDDFLASLEREKNKEHRRSTSREQDMQQPTQPIQSVLDNAPREPKRAPSHESQSGGQDAHLRQHFPMHGMKVTDIPPNTASTRPIPPHIDTRQQYAPHSQYATPTSSHHGSSHSGSPYSQGRGGWAGYQQPPQQYIGHHG